jgi:hypothetical protein
MKATIRVLTAVAVFAAACDSGWASYCIYIGKNLTADGSVFLAGYGDEPSSHWLEIVPAREWPPGATIKVGATAASQYPGTLIDIPQVRNTAKYITMNYSSFAGFPAPITNGGLNQHLVAARDVWSPSRDEEETLRADFELFVRDYFRRGRADDITGHLGVALQVRPKGRDASDLRDGYDADGRPTRVGKSGFYLRPGFVGRILAGFSDG